MGGAGDGVDLLNINSTNQTNENVDLLGGFGDVAPSNTEKNNGLDDLLQGQLGPTTAGDMLFDPFGGSSAQVIQIMNKTPI